MKTFLNYYLQTFKNIAANTSIFTTLIAAVILYSFFIQLLIKHKQRKIFRLLS